MKKADAYLKKLILIVFSLLLGLNLVCSLMSEMVDDSYYIWTGKSNLLFLFRGVCFLIFLYYIYSRFSDKLFSTNNPYLINRFWITVFATLLLIFYLILSTHFYYFEAGWDAGTVIWNAELLADGRISELDNAYYSIAPNNVFLTIIFSWIIKIGRILPLGTDYYVLVAFQCVCMALCSVLIYQTAVSLSFSRKAACMTRGAFLILVVLSPWVVLPYSDTMGMFFVILIVFLYSKNAPNAILGFLIILGTMIKPMVFIIAIALGIMGLPKILGDKATLKKSICKVVLFSGGALIASWGVGFIMNTSGLEPDKEKALSPAHFIMMGLNEEYRGVVNSTDQNYSYGIDYYDDRVEANLEVAKERLTEMGSVRLIRHLLRKEMYSFGDGSFAWGVEYQFFQTRIWTGHEKIENFFRSIYYPEGSHYLKYKGFEQMLWLGLLFFAIFGAFKKKNDKLYVLYLTVVGNVLFEMIFEPRARHLLLIAPIICLVAANGVSDLMDRMSNIQKG